MAGSTMNQPRTPFVISVWLPGPTILEQRRSRKYRRRPAHDSNRALEVELRCFLNLVPLAGRGRRAAPGEGVQVSRRSELADGAPHADPLPARGAERGRR